MSSVHKRAGDVVRISDVSAYVIDFFFFQAEDGIRDLTVTGVQTCALPISLEFAASRIHDELPEGVRIYPFPYWAGLRPEEAEQYLSGSVGIHANIGETSIRSEERRVGKECRSRWSPYH